MALHQYIGARYVPRFMGQYDAGTVYEGLDVVENGLGTSYIARKPVPANTPLTDTSYWAVYGASSGAIINLQNQIDVIDADIADINMRMKKRYIFIGDSYGHASGSNGWIDIVVNLLGLTVSDFYDSAQGGAGFTTSPTNFLSLLQTLFGNVDDPDTITDIVVLGGANDIAQTEQNVSNAIASFNTYAHTAFPRAAIKIGMIAGSADPTKIGIQIDRVLRGYSNCGIAEFLNNLEYVLHDRSLLIADMVHPTSAGFQLLGRKIVEALNGGCSVHYYEKLNPTYQTGYQHATLDEHYKATINNNLADISFGDRIGKVSTDATTYTFAMSSGAPIEICTINSNLIKGVDSSTYEDYHFMSQPCFATVYSTISNQSYTVCGVAEIYNDKLYFTAYDTILGTTGAFASLSTITIYGVHFTLNSMYC